LPSLTLCLVLTRQDHYIRTVRRTRPRFPTTLYR
jgi:hypothetical protein